MDFLSQFMNPYDNFESRTLHGMGMGPMNPYGNLGFATNEANFESGRQSSVGLLQLLQSLASMGLYTANQKNEQNQMKKQMNPTMPSVPSMPYMFGGQRYGMPFFGGTDESNR